MKKMGISYNLIQIERPSFNRSYIHLTKRKTLHQRRTNKRRVDQNMVVDYGTDVTVK